MHGVIAGGRIASALVVPEGSGAQRRLLSAGFAEGGIELLAEPRYTQFGGAVARLPGVTYLALRIIRAQGLVSRRPGGSPPSPKISAVWDSVSQHTRVLRPTQHPEVEETLYFPVRLVRITKEEMERKGDVVIYVRDHDPLGDEEIGLVRIALHQVRRQGSSIELGLLVDCVQVFCGFIGLGR